MMPENADESKIDLTLSGITAEPKEGGNRTLACVV